MATITRNASHTVTDADAPETDEQPQGIDLNANNGEQNRNPRVGTAGDAPSDGDTGLDQVAGLMIAGPLPTAKRGGAGKAENPMDATMVLKLKASLQNGGYFLFSGTNAEAVNTLTGQSATPAKWLKAEGLKGTHRVAYTTITEEMVSQSQAIGEAVAKIDPDAKFGVRSTDSKHKNDKVVIAYQVVPVKAE